uniref:Uncharacterized protein n=1 Tax=Brassica oleracea TaxID=3712 RepID=A0A3P6F5W3_BRAOL|nr:unnamed protein product [Brassica oleracea]
MSSTPLGKIGFCFSAPSPWRAKVVVNLLHPRVCVDV